MEPGKKIDRYEIITRIASGGMANVYLAKMTGPANFTRLVALKRPYDYVTSQKQNQNMFMAEARLAARIRHPNVVSTLDLHSAEGECFLVMEFVEGAGLSTLLKEARKRGVQVPIPVILYLLIDLLNGLHAAHELCNEQGRPLYMVHRDVSPHNVLVGVDGLAKISDFGIARVKENLHSNTPIGDIKGKLAYMAPEQITSQPLDRRTDLFACGIILWECLAARKLFQETDRSLYVERLLAGSSPDLRTFRPDLPVALYEIVDRALQRDPKNRFVDAMEFVDSLSFVASITGIASSQVVGQWVRMLAVSHLDRIQNAIKRNEGVLKEIEQTPGEKNENPIKQSEPSIQPITKSISLSSYMQEGYISSLFVLDNKKENSTKIPPRNTLFTKDDDDTDTENTNSTGVTSQTSTNSYLEHFSMSMSPFNDIRQPKSFWKMGPYCKTLEDLSAALALPSEPILLLGESGSGKTFLIEMLRYHKKGVQSFFIEADLLFGKSPLIELCRRCGIDTPSEASSTVLLQCFLNEILEQDPETNTILIVFDNFIPKSPKLLKKLSEIITIAPSMIRLVFIGSPELPEQLKNAGAHDLIPQGATTFYLRPMKLQEMNSYFDFRLQAILQKNNEIKFPSTVRRFVHARSGGLPKKVNIYCHNALMIAYLRQNSTLDNDIFRLAMKGQNYFTYEMACKILAADEASFT